MRLGIEPLHPMMIGERSAIVTLGEALDMAERIGDPDVGVVIDVYHVFWDPRIDEEIARAAGRIVGFHVNDWLAATQHTLLERGMMGDGIIELRRLRALVDAAGYDGPIEVEILNPAIWDLPRAELMAHDDRAVREVRALARGARRAARREPVRQHDAALRAAAEDRVRGLAAHLVQRRADRRQPDEARRPRVVDARRPRRPRAP